MPPANMDSEFASAQASALRLNAELRHQQEEVKRLQFELKQEVGGPGGLYWVDG